MPRVEAQRDRAEGEVPSAINPPSGCRFRTRCPARPPAAPPRRRLWRKSPRDIASRAISPDRWRLFDDRRAGVSAAMGQRHRHHHVWTLAATYPHPPDLRCGRQKGRQHAVRTVHHDTPHQAMIRVASAPLSAILDTDHRQRGAAQGSFSASFDEITWVLSSTSLRRRS